MKEEDLDIILSAALVLIGLIGGVLILVLATGIFGVEPSATETCSCSPSITCVCQNS